MAVRCSICNDLTSEKNVEKYNGKCPACYGHVQELGSKAAKKELDDAINKPDALEKVTGYKKEKSAVEIMMEQSAMLNAQTFVGGMRSGKTDFMEKVKREQHDRELGNMIDNLRTPEEEERMNEFFQRNVIEGYHTISVSPELKEAIEEWRKKEGKNAFLEDYPKLKEMKEQFDKKYAGTWVSPEEYDAEMQEHPRASEIELKSRRESALRQVASILSNDTLMQKYREAIVRRETLRHGKGFGLASEEDTNTAIRVYETELGNRLARKGKDK